MARYETRSGARTPKRPCPTGLLEGVAGEITARRADAPMTSTCAIYCRAPTTGDRQTTENQERELRAVAERSGWQVTAVYADHGVSGMKTDRPALKKLLRAVGRREVDIVAVWSVDRLGRSLQHLLPLLGEIRAKGVDLDVHQQGLDTRTPAGTAMFQMLGVFAAVDTETRARATSL